MARGRGKWGGKAVTRDGKVRRAASRDLRDLRISGSQGSRSSMSVRHKVTDAANDRRGRKK